MDTLLAKSEVAFQNPYLMGGLKIGGILYAAILAPKLPSNARATINSSLVKLIIIAAIALIAQRDFQLALVLTIAFVASLDMNVKEMFSNFTKQPIDKSKLLEPKVVIYPGCHDITMQGLLDAFSGDNMKMQQAVRHVFHDLMQHENKTDAEERLVKYARLAGLPYNIELSDENAPLIATMLLQYGYKFSDQCQPPQ
jgi:hypothetical protein